jgi:hypothetical protein
MRKYVLAQAPPKRLEPENEIRDHVFSIQMVLNQPDSYWDAIPQ